MLAWRQSKFLKNLPAETVKYCADSVDRIQMLLVDSPGGLIGTHLPRWPGSAAILSPPLGSSQRSEDRGGRIH